MPWLRGSSPEALHIGHLYEAVWVQDCSKEKSWCLPTLQGDCYFFLPGLVHLLFLSSFIFYTYKQIEGCRWCEMTKWCDIFVYNVQSQQVWVLWLWQTWFLNRVHHMSFPEILLLLSLWHTVKSGPSFLWGFGGPFEAWSSEYHQDLRGQKHGSAKRDPSYCKGSWLGYNILYRRSISTPFWWFLTYCEASLSKDWPA